MILKYLQVLKCQVKIFCQYEANDLEIITITATVKMFWFMYIYNTLNYRHWGQIYVFFFWIDEH